MSKKQLFSICTNQVDAKALNAITQFLPIIKSRYIEDVKRNILSLLVVEVIISIFFAAITHNFTLSLFVSIYPFLLLILIGYSIIIISQLIHLYIVTSNVQKALLDSCNILVCQDAYIFESEDRHRIGNDTSSELVQSFCFKKSGPVYGQRLYIGKNSHNCFFDYIEKGSSYNIYAVLGRYIMFIRKF